MLLLPFKITSLLRTGDSCINIFKRLFSGGKGGGGGKGDEGGTGEDMVDIVETDSTIGTFCFYKSLSMPATKSPGGDSKLFGCLMSRKESH